MASQGRYNARFSLGSKNMDVVVQSFSYSFVLASTGKSQTRQTQTIYPKRVEQTDLSLELAFRSVDEYVLFGRFVDMCNKHMTTYNNPLDLILSSDSIPSRRKSYDGEPISGIVYSVAFDFVSMSVALDTVAPTISVSLKILRDMMDTEISDWGMSDTGGSVVNLVDPDAVGNASNVMDADTLFLSKAESDFDSWLGRIG